MMKRSILLTISILSIGVNANLWDNLWSNNRANRVVFPQQFDLTLSWNPTLAGQLHPPLRSVNNTNYIQGHIMIDQVTNRLRMDTKYSTLSLAPQELVSYILDFDNKHFYLKQKNHCKYFDIVLQNMMGNSKTQKDSTDDESQKVGFDIEIDRLPNIAELFDLFPYVMYYTGARVVDNAYLHEFKYSYPLGKQQQTSNEAELLMQFSEDSNEESPMMSLKTIILRANSLNITDPFKLYATKPIKEQKWTLDDMKFEPLCEKATEDDQNKLNHYVQRIFELVTNTK